ncbi:SH3 domain-containing protein [Alkalinema pantanalense CENA528]|uniref:SH3 domain-containing protein n=1 Tax=Alkalinema pantanalense TaxID=1620705 RepID=UPI003D6EDEB7
MKFPIVATIVALGLFTVGCGGERSASNANSNNSPQQPAATENAPSNSAAANNAAAVAAPNPASPAASAPTATSPASPSKVANQSPQSAPASSPEGTNDNTYFVNTNDGSALNVRADISTNATIVGSIPNGTQVLMHISDRSGEWLEVSAPGNIRGWVSAQYLVDRNGNTASPSLTAAAQRLANSTRANQAAEAQSANSSERTYRVKTVDGTALNLRVKPQLGTEVVAKLSNGAIVTEVGTVGQWTEVVTSDGLRGYVATDYLVEN